jgi:uroporphyrin-III C-methyltransferase
MKQLPDDFLDFPEFAPGEVWLTGAGPGDPRLLTLMALHGVQTADDIVHDSLVDSRIFRLARADADIIPAGKRGGKPSPHQADINILLIERAKAGRKVLRLKGGDPFVFGRGGEEALALTRAGVRFRIIPGITSGLAGPALAGIPATTRTTNHAIILATGHRAVDDACAAEWEALARTGQPIILYMAMSHFAEIAVAFQRGGFAADTPTTVIEAATTDRERVFETQLSIAAQEAGKHGIGAPAIIVVGAVAELRRELLAGMVGLR